MNFKIKELIDKVNQITDNAPLIYFTRDPERAVGLERLIKNFHIICIDNSYIVDELVKSGFDIFSTDKEGIVLPTNSTKDLVKDPKVQEKIKKISKGGKFYAQFFQYQMPTGILIKEMGGIIVNNSPEINRQLEDKLTQHKFFSRNNINIADAVISNLSDYTYQDLAGVLGGKLVCQLNRSHSGKGTFFINNEEDYIKIANEYSGNEVKLSRFVNGQSYTINALVRKNDNTLIGTLQYQIIGYPQLAADMGTTVGNDWSYGSKIEPKLKALVDLELFKIGKGLQVDGYLGHFGVDFILSDDNHPYIIEINGRQTANSSLETKLSLMQDKTPLMLLHLVEFLGIDYEIDNNSIRDIQGSQIFLRSKKDGFKVNHELKSGVYRLQSDNSAIDWNTLQRKENVIFVDEEMDKPMIWQSDGYSVDQIKEGGFILLTSRNDSIKEKADELVRMQFIDQIILDGKISPWILEGMEEIESMIK